MSKYNLSWDQKKYERYLKEGRGSGIGNDYKPWITIHDFPSKGVSSRSPGWKTNRVYHFLSHNELRYFYHLEWVNEVIDIREQFPLLDLDDAMEIAEKSNIKYPIDSKSKTPYILSSDFMITIKRDGKEIQIVRTVKPTEDLDRNNVIKNFEIERQYWKKRNIDWGIVTENEIDRTFAQNVEWIHSAYYLEPTKELNVNDLLSIGEILKDRLSLGEGYITKITTKLDREMNLDVGTTFYIFRHLVAKKQIVLDMKQKVTPKTPVHTIKEIIKNDSKVMVL